MHPQLFWTLSCPMFWGFILRDFLLLLLDFHFLEDMLVLFSQRNRVLIGKGSSFIWQHKDSIQLDPNHARFQRTDQWMPVYSWLESLDTDELIKSEDIIDWLSANPEIKEQLYSRHSRYHLMHYIKKCHIKMLKRKEKKKVWPFCTVDFLVLLYSWSLRVDFIIEFLQLYMLLVQLLWLTTVVHYCFLSVENSTWMWCTGRFYTK